MPSPAFRGGLVNRSGLLGDPTGDKDPGAAKNWVVGRPGAELDALVVIAGDHAEPVARLAEALAGRFAAAGAEAAIEPGRVRPDLPGHEHFGFDDGVSQPGIRGLASETPGDFVTERYLDPDLNPDAGLFGYPGQELIWPGELVFGYPASSPDPLIPGPVMQGPAWMRNGSFLVYRRLRQDVGLFWRTLRAEAARLSELGGFKGLNDLQLAARLVGRWPSGAPITRTPRQDDPRLGKDPLANNDFRFDDDTPARLGLPPASSAFTTGAADPIGLACPAGAHIRKVNVRDQASDVGAASSTQSRRLLRVGVPFGAPLADKYDEGDPDPQQGDRGLLFLSIQTSIEDQFEFLQARWINNPSRPRGPWRARHGGGAERRRRGRGAPLPPVRRRPAGGRGPRRKAVRDAHWRRLLLRALPSAPWPPSSGPPPTPSPRPHPGAPIWPTAM